MTQGFLDPAKGSSLNYVSIFEGGRGHKMLTDAYLGEGVYLKCLCKHFDNLSKPKLPKKGVQGNL